MLPFKHVKEYIYCRPSDKYFVVLSYVLFTTDYVFDTFHPKLHGLHLDTSVKVTKMAFPRIAILFIGSRPSITLGRQRFVYFYALSHERSKELYGFLSDSNSRKSQLDFSTMFGD